MLILVTYDVETSDKGGPRRLRDVAKVCKNFGQRVQNSVFECYVDNTQYADLKIKLKSIITGNDSIRFYNLGNHYYGHVDTIGRSRGIRIEGELIV